MALTKATQVPASSVTYGNGGYVQSSQNFISYDMFPTQIDLTGSTDSHDGLMYVHGIANALGLRVVQHTGKILLGKGSGTGSIPCKYGLDLRGLTLKIASNFGTYDGFTFSNPEGYTLHESSSALVTAINASTMLRAQSGVMDGLANLTEWDGSVLCIYGSTKLYKARGADVTFRSMCYLATNGRMDSVFKYDPGTVSSVVQMKNNLGQTEVYLPNLDFSENVGPLQVFFFNYATNYRVFGGRVISRNGDNKHQTSICSFKIVAGIVLEGFTDIHPQNGFNGATTGQTIYTNYTFNWDMVKDMTMRNCTSQGYGWGVTGGGYSWGFTFDNCNINRYDWHEAAFDYVRIIDSIVGNYGCIGTFCCDVWAIRCIFDFANQTQPEIANSNYHNALFGARPDYGGWADGNLYIKDCVVNGYLLDKSSTDSGIALFKTGVDAVSAIGTDTSYAVTPRFWRDIIVDGLRFNRYGMNVNNIIWNSSTDQVIYAPRSIKLHNVDFNNKDAVSIQLERFTPEPGASATGSPLITGCAPHIELSNVENMKGIAIPTASNDTMFNPRVTVRGMKNTRYGADKPWFAFSTRGHFTFDEACDILSISSSYGGRYSSQGVVVKIMGSHVGPASGSPITVGASSAFVDSWTAVGATLVGDFSASAVTATNTTIARHLKLKGCSLVDLTGAFVPSLMLATAITVPLYVQSGSLIELRHNVSSVASNSQIFAATTGGHTIPVLAGNAGTQKATTVSMGARGNQSLISAITTTADSIDSIALVHQ